MQCAPDFVEVAALVALGSLIGRRVAIRPQRHTDWQEVCNQWGCIIGKPGVLKSPAVEEAIKPLKRLEAKAREAQAEIDRQHALQVEAYRIRKEEAGKSARNAAKIGGDIAAALDVAAPDEPKRRRYLTNNFAMKAWASFWRTIRMAYLSIATNLSRCSGIWTGRKTRRLAGSI